MSFSFRIKDNTIIRDFLLIEGKSPPVSEYLYLHEHPLLRPNFLTEIDDLVKETGELIISRKVSGAPIEKLSALVIRIGSKVDLKMNEDQAKEVLLALKEVYQLCLKLKMDLSKR